MTQENSKKRLFVSILGIIAIVACVGGLTYAFFNYVRTGSVNTIKVGKIVFNSSETDSIHLTNFIPISSEEALTDNVNAGTASVRISGDTDYNGGIEYLVKTVDVNNIVNNKTIPISVMVSFSESTGKTIGTADNSYFANRGGDSSIYKLLSNGKVIGDDNILVGYIAKGQTGIDGVLSIRAYVDENDIIVSDTYSEPTNKVVLTTSEWSSLKGNNALSFKIKVEANEGTWVQNITSSYIIAFNSEGGSLVNNIEVDQGGLVGEFPRNPTRAGYVFNGWFTEREGGTQVTESTVVNGNMNLHAQWDKLVCLKVTEATDLHTETCTTTGSKPGSCASSGYSAENPTITYGTVPTSSPVSGDAYNCDVNNDDNYTSQNNGKFTERFYYVGKDNNDKAMLIYYTSIDETGAVDTRDRQGGSYHYDVASTYLPTTTDWSNPSLTTYNGKAARFLKYADVPSECINNMALCQYMMENSRFQDDNKGRAGIWLERNSSNSDNTTNGIRIQTKTKVVATSMNSTDTSSGSENTTRPVIEIPVRLIEGYKKTYHVTFDSQGGSTVSGRDVESGSQLGALPAEPVRAHYTFAGWYTSPTYVKEVTSSTVIESERTFYAKWEESETPYNTVTFNAGDGTVSDTERPVDSNHAVGELPIPTPPTGYIFDAWYNQAGTEIYTAETIISDDITFYARYTVNTNYVEMNGTYYTTIQAAVNAAPTSTKTTIRVLQDITLTGDGYIDITSSSNTGKNLVLDLGGHKIDYLVGSSNTKNVIKTAATIEIKNGTINSSAKAGAIDIVENGKLIMNSGTINATGERQAVYNEGGIVEIGGTAEFTSNTSGTYGGSNRATVQSSSGSLTITGGTITNSAGAAVSFADGTLIIGTEDNAFDSSSPVIQGKTYGVSSASASFSFYDGILKGETNSTDVDIDTKITSETGATKVIGTSGAYKTLIYQLPQVQSYYTLNLNAGGGTVNSNSVPITVGDTINSSELPTPTWGSKTFNGWYSDEEYTTAVPSTITALVSGTANLYAKWTYTPVNAKVTYNSTNDAMTEYFSNISTWKDLPQSTFQSTMLSNFNTNSCSSCNAENNCTNPLSGTQCDKPKSYNTNVGGAVKVYLYEETNHVIKKEALYANGSTGTIINLIPGQTYYWEKASDSTVNGLIEFTTPRRTLDAGNVRNVRDLGGMNVDTNNDGTVDGTLKYGRLFRGAKLSSSQDDVTALTNLGITREIDLRADSEGSGQVRLPVLDNGTGGSDIVIENYLINHTSYTYSYTHGGNSYTSVAANTSRASALKSAIKTTMQYIVDGDNIYFHCTIGTDRTGTIAYFLEGLLGVSEEDRIEDYELSYFFGLVVNLGARDRYHDDLTSTPIYPRFKFMRTMYQTNQQIYNWYTSVDPASDDLTLLSDFRDAMINYNS